MSDVNTFIDAIGRDVTSVTVPRIEAFAETVNHKAVSDYGPKIAAFASQLFKQILDEQSTTVRDFTTTLVQDLCARYRPELAGELHTTIVQGGVQVNGQGVRLDLKQRDTGAVVASLDVPVALTIKVGELGVTIQDGMIRLNVVR